MTGSLPGLAPAGAVLTNLVVNLGERLLDASVMGASLLLCNEVALGRGCAWQREDRPSQ